MPIITIYQGASGEGQELAERVADAVGYRCVGREVLVEASRRFPLDHLAHRLDLEGAVQAVGGPRQGGAQELEAGEVGILAVARVEDHVLRVAVLVAHPEVVTKRRGHRVGRSIRAGRRGGGR